MRLCAARWGTKKGMDLTTKVAIRGINPEPWTSPSVSVGRKNGKPFPMVYKSAALRAYQEAIGEAVAGRTPLVGPISLTFYLWRQLPAYTTDRQRKARKHEADATNLQKALEDALQGHLFENDRDCVHVQTWIMEQGHDTEPLIVIEMEKAPALPTIEVPDERAVSLFTPVDERERQSAVEGLF
jgi:Holliday junction resolvase RusA-like endonuclease